MTKRGSQMFDGLNQKIDNRTATDTQLYRVHPAPFCGVCKDPACVPVAAYGSWCCPSAPAEAKTR